jgi:hypothetical protein
VVEICIGPLLVGWFGQKASSARVFFPRKVMGYFVEPFYTSIRQISARLMGLIRGTTPMQSKGHVVNMFPVD